MLCSLSINSNKDWFPPCRGTSFPVISVHIPAGIKHAFTGCTAWSDHRHPWIPFTRPDQAPGAHVRHRGQGGRPADGCRRRPLRLRVLHLAYLLGKLKDSGGRTILPCPPVLTVSSTPRRAKMMGNVLSTVPFLQTAKLNAARPAHSGKNYEQGSCSL